MRRSHRLALSVATLLFASAIGGAALRPGGVTAASGRGAGSGAVAPADTSFGTAFGRDAGRAALDVRESHAADATALATEAALLAARRAPPAASTAPPPITLDDPRALGVALVLAGRDPGAPRPLDLWRIEADGRAARVARGRSAPDGSLEFGPLVLPSRAIELVATPRGGAPRAAGASRPVVARRDPAAPRVVAASQGDGLLLRVHAAESGGAIVVERVGAADAGETPTLAHVELEARADAVPAPVEIALADARGVALQVVQIDPDGRRSSPRPVFLADEDNQPTQE